MSRLLITRGLPASGKTTFAKRWVDQDPIHRARVNRDDLRLMVYNRQFDPALEKQITVAQHAAVGALLDAGFDVVADDTNLRPRYVRDWRRFAVAKGHDFRVQEFPIDVEEAIHRDRFRERPVGEDVIRGMMKYLRDGELLPVPDEQEVPGPVLYQPRWDLPPAIIVDIDGTVALNAAGRNYYDLTRVSEDVPNPPVIQAVKAARESGLRIIFCSGREDTCREDTALWLKEHVGRTDDEPLFMRAADDKRRDSIVKLELFDQHIRDQYNVRWVYDDRDQVVEAWRAMGLTVMQVAEGAF